MQDFSLPFKVNQSFRYRHFENPGNIFSLRCYFERLVIEPAAVAAFTQDLHASHKMHSGLFIARPFAVLATAAFRVERKTALSVSSGNRSRQQSEQVPDIIEQACISGGIASRSAAYRRLVDLNKPFDAFQTRN